ncbi:MAG: mechanosensitive ion channel [Desulfobacterales bacterium]|nr:mechanosensitive ion channel [Desulfobacterales bacterium]
MEIEKIYAQIQELVTVFGMRILAAVAILFFGWWAAKIIRSIIRKLMERAHVDPTIITFVKNLAYIALLAFVFIAALGKLGIQTASFIAVLGAAGLAVGLALQGSLANFAAGVLLIIFRPFRVDDVIDAAGVIGKVEKIEVFTTQLKTPDNKTIIIPNSKLTADNIVNISAKPTRRVDMIFGVGYEDDLDKVKQVIESVLTEDERILKDPAPTIGLVELADSSVNFAVRPWVNAADYWDVYFDTHEKMKKRFDAEKIAIPYPQRDVHVYEHKAAEA